jgi:DUF1680 family protein
MISFRFFLGYVLLPALFISCIRTDVKKPPVDYPVTPISFTQVQLKDNFWLPRIIKNTEITIPIAFKQCEETGRIDNFEIAGGLKEGTFCSKYAFDDSDVFKIIEGASYSLMIRPDIQLELFLDSLIIKIALAQEDDGYLYTNRTIMGDSALPMAGKKRWENESEHSHELYNAGHLYEAAVAHFQATHKRTLLDVAIKNADLIEKEFGWGKIEKFPGHQEIEIGLVKLYRLTGEKKYLDLAKFFLDVRGPGGWEYNQAHTKPADQREPVGHAVRALYMYSAMTDIAALTASENYITAINAIWEHLVGKKIYITGGVGQSAENEGFGPDYELPNLTAYCETCASIANVFWNHRMFLLSGDSKYIDVMELTMYNALLSGVSLSGDRFFYPNPLESDGTHERREWFGCACCPSNLVRFLPSVPGYIYAMSNSDIYINLFISSEATLGTPDENITILQKNNYPWDENMIIDISANYISERKIYIRVPGWSRNEPIPGDLYDFKRPAGGKMMIKVNGIIIDYKIDKGYAVLERKWEKDTRIEIFLPMNVEEILANKNVITNSGCFSLQRGPLVFCVENPGKTEPTLTNILATRSTGFTTQFEPDLLSGIQTIEFFTHTFNESEKGNIRIDREKRKVKAIPYCYWANRGPAEMMVWIPYKKKNGTHKPENEETDQVTP